MRLCSSDEGEPRHATRKGKIGVAAATKWPDGQITSDLRKIMSSPEIKNISLFQKRELGYINAHPVPLRVGVGRRHDEGRVAVDAEAATDARGQSVRQRRVVLTPRCWRRRWQQYMAHRGEHVISRKAIAQGVSDVLRCPVCSCAQLSTILHTRSRVQRASGIPCALCFERRENYLQTSGAMCREIAATYPVVIVRHRGRPNGRPMTGSGG